MHLMSLICCEFIIIVYWLRWTCGSHFITSKCQCGQSLPKIRFQNQISFVHSKQNLTFTQSFVNFPLYCSFISFWTLKSHSLIFLITFLCETISGGNNAYRKTPANVRFPLWTLTNMYTPCLFWLKQHGCNFGGFPALVIVGYSSDLHPVFFFFSFSFTSQTRNC